MRHQPPLSAISLAAVLFILAVPGGEIAGQACGTAGELPCKAEKKVYCGDPQNLCTRFKQVCDPKWPRLDQNGRCAALPPSDIPVPQTVDFIDNANNKNEVTQGFVARVDLGKAGPIVPRTTDPPSCPAGNLSTVVPNTDVPTDNWIDDPTYAPRLAVNGSFFDVGLGSAWAERCSHVFGYTLSDGFEVRPQELIVAQGVPLLTPGTLMFYSPHSTDRPPAEIKWYKFAVPQAGVVGAISGAQLVKDGGYVGDSVSGPLANQAHPRTAVGLMKDNKTLLVVSVSATDARGKTTLAGLADYLIKLGAWNAINLDGGGSAQFYYIADDGKKTISIPTDSTKNYPGQILYRPIANFLGFH